MNKIINYYGLESPLPPDYVPNKEFNIFIASCIQNLTLIDTRDFYEICFTMEQVKTLLHRWNVELNKKPELTYNLATDGDYYIVRKKRPKGRKKKCARGRKSCWENN